MRLVGSRCALQVGQDVDAGWWPGSGAAGKGAARTMLFLGHLREAAQSCQLALEEDPEMFIILAQTTKVHWSSFHF